MIRFALVSAAACAAAILPASASLTAEQTVEKVIETVAEDGTVTTELVAADVVAPGDMVVYGLSYTNNTDSLAEGVALTMPVPGEVDYVEGSATSDNVKVSFSVDGGNTFTSRGELTVSLDGDTRMALAEDITHIQWRFDDGIPAGAAGKITFSAVLN